jgi:hypothetical protein
VLPIKLTFTFTSIFNFTIAIILESYIVEHNTVLSYFHSFVITFTR